MKTENYWIIAFLVTMFILPVGCSDGDEIIPKEKIEVQNEEALTQTSYANNEKGKEISFSTPAAWSSVIGSTADTRASDSPDWLSISPESGDKAGNYNVTIHLTSNLTGKDRSAYIHIVSADTKVTINVTQMGTKEDGETLGRRVIFHVNQCNENWNGSANPYLTNDGDTLTLFKNSLKVGTYQTDEDGLIELLLENGEYEYLVSNDDMKNISKAGYLIAGIYTSQEEIDQAPKVETGSLNPGDLMLSDLDGDGVINKNDFVTKAPLTVAPGKEETQTVEVYMAALDFAPLNRFSYDEEKFTLSRNYGEMIRLSYIIDAALTHEADIPAYKQFSNYSFTAKDNSVADLWNASYGTILTANNILDRIVYIPEYSHAEKDKYMVEATYYRAYAYGMLLSYFGGVPLISSHAFPDDAIRSSEAETVQFIIQDCDEVAGKGDGFLKYAALQLKARNFIFIKNWDGATDALTRIIDSNKYTLPAGNEWGKDAISEGLVFASGVFPDVLKKGDRVYPVRYTETLLLYGEAMIELGRATMVAADYLNELLLMAGKAPLQLVQMTQEQLRGTVNMLWKDILSMEGHSFFQLRRTNRFISFASGFGATEKHKLLPIPDSVIQKYRNIQLNPGW